GLISAIERYDLDREIKFETFAITRIKGSIIDELRSLDWVPRSVRARARQIEKANAMLEHRLHRAPTDAEVAAELDMAIEDYENLTLREIGEVLGVTESRVSQLHTKAVLRLKSALQADVVD